MGTEFFIQPDGSRMRSGARQTVAPREVAKAWLHCTRIIPPQFAVGTAYHESSYTLNELDVEPNGHTTGGIFQLDEPTLTPLVVGDAVAAGMPEKSIYRLDDACAIFAALCERYLARILDAVDRWNSDHDLPPLDRRVLPLEIWAYVAMAHNQGLGTYSGTKGALGTIGHFGLDWEAYKVRNSGADYAQIAWDRGHGIYGDDVQSGGPHWEPEFALPFEEDAAGDVVEIPEPAITAALASRLRLGLLGLLLLLLLLAAIGNGSPWKGSV